RNGDLWVIGNFNRCMRLCWASLSRLTSRRRRRDLIGLFYRLRFNFYVLFGVDPLDFLELFLNWSVGILDRLIVVFRDRDSRWTRFALRSRGRRRQRKRTTR